MSQKEMKRTGPNLVIATGQRLNPWRYFVGSIS